MQYEIPLNWNMRSIGCPFSPADNGRKFETQCDAINAERKPH
jgi:hypothetical protein